MGMPDYDFHSATPSEAEALSLLEAIPFTINQVVPPVIFESDCKLLVDAVNSPYAPQDKAGYIISRCKDLMSSRNNYVVKYVRRQVNKGAHSIARASISHRSSHIFSDVPSYLYSLLIY
jgi:ribonuclease HI